MSETNVRKFPAIEAGVAANIDAMPMIDTLLPFNFGRASKIDRLECQCAACGANLTAETIKGEIERIADGTTVRITAYGICYGCHTVTPIDARLNDDGTALYKNAEGWSQQTWSNPEQVVTGVRGFVLRHWEVLLPPAVALIVGSFWLWLRLR